MASVKKANAARDVRDLAALQRSGSSSRVLNLAQVEGSLDPEYEQQPFFLNRTLNTCILVKHRLRTDERFVFDMVSTTATKIIVPFSCRDLTLGGRSMFVGQRGWHEMLEEMCANPAELERDARVLTLIDKLPSLDPFLVREHLKRHGFEIGRCYFSISAADYDRMQNFVKREISRLIELAFAGTRTSSSDSSRMVQILLSSDVDERFEPLRKTLGLHGDAYREGIFCWKGFLYYKWVLADLWPRLLAVMAELKTIKLTNRHDTDLMRYIERSRSRLGNAIHTRRRDLAAALAFYDDAFRALTENGDPGAFRDFLVKAPAMFMTLGERIGGISHIASFWRYCVPDAKAGPIAADDLYEILLDFEASLGVEDAGDDAYRAA
jgi:hypothetical protein